LVARRRLADSYERLTAGLAIAEAVETSQESEETNPALFRLVVEALDALAAAEENEFSIVVAFQLRLAELMGFALSMGDETLVGEPRTEYHFSFTDGTILPANDYRVPSVGWVFAPAEFAVINALAECEMCDASGVGQTVVQKAKIHDFLSRYFQFHIEKKMRYRAHTLLLG
jgi:recombinational DNA repair protein (RecF pathway)